MNRRLKTGRTLSVAIVAMLVAVGSACTAGAASLPVLAPGSVATTSLDGLGAVAPFDGRLRGQGFSAVVTGVAAVRHSKTRRAGSGQHLVAFGVSVAGPNGTDSASPAPAGRVIADGQAVPINTPDHGRAAWIVSVPDKTSTLNLELTSGGLSQDFDLLHLARTGPVPSVLYRTATADTVGSTSLPVETNLVVSDPSSGESVNDPISLTSATLGYWDPDSHPATGPDKAILTVEFTSSSRVSADNGDVRSFAEDFQPYPGDAVHVRLADGTLLAATHGGPIDKALLPGTYSFEVPADMTNANVELGATTGMAVAFQFSGNHEPVHLGGADFALSFPAVPAPVSAAATTLAVRDGPSVPSAGSGSVIGLLVILMIVALFVGIMVRRGQRKPQPTTNEPYAPVPTGWYASRPAPTAATCPPMDTGAFPRGGAPPATAETAEAAVVPVPPSNGLSPSLPEAAEWVEPRPHVIDADIVVRVLGPVTVEGWVTPPDRAIVTDLLVYLAMHQERPVPAYRLINALWPDDTATSSEEKRLNTLRTNISRLRAAIGADHLADAAKTGGYALTGVTTDWEAFERAVANAGDDVDLRASALALVEGLPFGGDAPKWADEESAVGPITVRVADLADSVARAALQDGRPMLARWAATRGLAAAPHDPRLHANRIMADAALRRPDLLGIDREEARRLGIEVPAET